MKALVVYDTKTGNTPKIAEAIAKALKCKAKKVSDVKSSEIKNYNLVGFGSGIYALRHSNSILKFVDSIDELKGKEVFIFSTSGIGKKFQHFALRKKLKKKKAWLIGEFACKGHDKFLPIKWLNFNKGHPDKKDVENANGFAKELMKR